MSTTTEARDTAAKSLFQLVQTKKLAIANAGKPNWETNGEFTYSPSKNEERHNIRLATNVEKLADILIFLTERSKNRDEAFNTLGIELKPFKWLGYTVQEWTADLKTRVDQINIDTKKKELASLEARLNAVLSPELKAQMELEAIQAEVLSLK